MSDSTNEGQHPAVHGAARDQHEHGPAEGSRHGRDGGHHGHPAPYEDPDYDRPAEHPTEPPPNPRYPDASIYGSYASDEPPRYVPHPFDHACFRPRKEDYKPPVACDDDGSEDGLCHRKDHRRFTVDEQNRFLNAFSQANALGALAPMVDIHANATHQMHGNPRFLPWHRIYLVKFEQLLMSIDPTVCIPYWRSSDEQAFPSWLLGFTPTLNLIGGPHTVTRSIGMFGGLPSAASVTAAMGNNTFSGFAPALEGIHNSGHVWVGGSMGIVPTAPADPAFWMHHAEIDRIWAEWQTQNPGEDPPLAGAASIMDPWPETEADTRDTASMGYVYD